MSSCHSGINARAGGDLDKAEHICAQDKLTLSTVDDDPEEDSESAQKTKRKKTAAQEIAEDAMRKAIEKWLQEVRSIKSICCCCCCCCRVSTYSCIIIYRCPIYLENHRHIITLSLCVVISFSYFVLFKE